MQKEGPSVEGSLIARGAPVAALSVCDNEGVRLSPRPAVFERLSFRKARHLLFPSPV